MEELDDVFSTLRVQRNEPGHADSGGRVILTFHDDEQLARIHKALSVARQSPEAVTDELRVLREALFDAREAIAGLDEDALGEVTTSYDRHGNPATGYPVRDELLSKIDAALLKVSPR